MVNYQNAKIYTIRSHQHQNEIYVGYTTRPLSERFSQHKRDSKNMLLHKKNKLYHFVKNWDEWFIELYENNPCSNIEEILKKENDVVRAIGTLNTVTYSRYQ